MLMSTDHTHLTTLNIVDTMRRRLRSPCRLELQTATESCGCRVESTSLEALEAASSRRKRQISQPLFFFLSFVCFFFWFFDWLFVCLFLQVVNGSMSDAGQKMTPSNHFCNRLMQSAPIRVFVCLDACARDAHRRVHKSFRATHDGQAQLPSGLPSDGAGLHLQAEDPR